MNNLIRSGERRLGWAFFGDVDNVVNGLFRAPMASSLNSAIRLPAIDINETEGAYLVKAELPGMRKQDLDITIDNGVVTINAEHVEKADEKSDGRLIRRERSYGKFTRLLHLGEDVDEEKVTANYQDGILSLTLPKAEKAQSRQVKIAIS